MASASFSLRRLATLATLATLLVACAREPGLLGPKVAQTALPLPRVESTKTALVAFDTTPFPFHGTAPGAAKAFMDVDDDGRLGHSSARNGTLWEDQTYSDQRVLLSLPAGFDPARPSAIVVFLHGNEATLERDVRDRQSVPRQLAKSGLNAVLVAPQFAVDARDSSAGRFWQPGVFSQFLHEADRRLAELYGTHAAEFVFDHAPVILVAYSGGYLPAAAALRYGHAGGRIRGLVLLDALYGEADTFQNFIEHRGSGFFVSVYGKSSKDGNEALKGRLQSGGVGFETALGPAIAPGSVGFVNAGETVPHGDFVTQALNGDPLADVLSRIKGFPRGPEMVASGAGAVQ